MIDARSGRRETMRLRVKERVKSTHSILCSKRTFEHGVYVFVKELTSDVVDFAREASWKHTRNNERIQMIYSN